MIFPTMLNNPGSISIVATALGACIFALYAKKVPSFLSTRKIRVSCGLEIEVSKLANGDQAI